MISLDKKYKTVGGYEVKLEKINTLVEAISVSGRWKDSRGVWFLCEWDIKTGYLYGAKPGKLSLIEIEENMISLDKKYKTLSGNEVVLLEIYNNQVFGRVVNALGNWYSEQWNLCGIHSNSNLNLVEVPEFKIVNVKQNFIKPVLYYGTLFTVPKNINYMATDKDGNVFGYYSKPTKLGADVNMWINNDYCDAVKIGVVEFEGDWRQSLQQV
jgi:hypothetical protein